MAKSKHRPQPSRSGGNTYLLKQAEEKRKRLKRQDVLTQMCLDAAMIAANETFQRKGSIIIEFAAKMMSIFEEIAINTVEDAKDDPEFIYTKTKLDERLKSILGDSYQCWDERYNGGE